MADRDDKSSQLQPGFTSLPSVLELWEPLQLHESTVATDLTLQNPNLRERVQVKNREEIYGGRLEWDQL